MYIYHFFLIHSSVNGHLGCFHVLAIVNCAALNTRMHVSFLRKVLSGYMPKSGVAGSYGSPMYSFLRYFHTVLHVVVPAYIPTNSAGRFPFSIPPPAFVICRLINDGHSDWCEVISHSRFDLHFCNNR